MKHVKKMPGGGHMNMKKPMMPGGGKMKPMYMYGGKVYAEKGAMLKAILEDPEQRAMAKKELGVK
tara:strand:- start:637 stop:831 length:195 start_codon:yes stop_codon:yes gene_type:complete